VLVKDIYPAPPFPPRSSNPNHLTAFGDTLMFFARSGDTQSEQLWRSDGTAAGTVEVEHRIGQGGSTAVVGDTFYFGAYAAGSGLWKSDGRTATLVKPFENETPRELTAADGKLYFVGYTPATGAELWVSDGTTAGTVMAGDIAPGPDSSGTSNLEVVARTLFFSADSGLWKVDLGALPAVVGRHVFYNHSGYDGDNGAANAADDNAIATDKAALLPGESASFANVTSFDRGINGVMVDIVGLPQGATLTPDDFEIAGDGSRPLTVSVRRGAGMDGSDRVTLTWPDYNPLTDPVTMAVANGWLRVTVKANANTGLAAPDVFSFGNLIGETGDAAGAAEARVTALDLASVRRALNAAPAADSRTDFNRDGKTNALDLAIVRRALNRTLALMPMTAPTAPALPARRAADELLA